MNYQFVNYISMYLMIDMFMYLYIYLSIYLFIHPFLYVSKFLWYIDFFDFFFFFAYSILFSQNPSPHESLTRMIIEMLVIGGSFFWAYISMIVFIIFNSDDRY